MNADMVAVYAILIALAFLLGTAVPLYVALAIAFANAVLTAARTSVQKQRSAVVPLQSRRNQGRSS